MKRGRLPLTALRSFEAAGRLCSFTLAAEELAVSQAAVSRQVRELESLIGRRLFERLHRGVGLTAEGRELLPVLTRAFDEMEARLAAFEAGPPAPEVRISAEPSFASGWLVHHLEDFRARHPGIDVVVDSDPRLIAFRHGEPELAIRHSARTRHWPSSESRHLMDATEVVVASPRHLESIAEIRRPADLLAGPLLHQENRDFWRRWFEAMGVAPALPIRGSVYADGGILLQAVLMGQGVALLEEAFARPEIESGRLVRLFGQAIDCGAYFLVARDFRRLSAPAASFVRWIEDAVRDPA